MTEYCKLCGKEHETKPITFEEAVVGSVLLALTEKETPELIEAKKKFSEALEKTKERFRK